MTNIRQKTIDLRSDTVTRPTPEMRRAMAEATVGDDVFGDDPTVNQLQEEIARKLGKDAALFVPSGTMANQVAIRVHCRAGDELLCEADSHVYQYEQGGFAQLSGVVAHTIKGEQGVLRRQQIEPCLRREDDHFARTRLLCLENTHNRGGGTVQPFDELQSCCRWAQLHGLRTHLDGARLFNAVVASGIEADRWAEHFDTVSVCFSKSLGAPVGSALVGSAEVVRQARRIRKLFGGGMRQAGVIAAAALYALNHHIERLATDHRHAQQIIDGIADIAGLQPAQQIVATNIIFFELDPRLGTAQQFVSELASRGVWMLAEGPTRIRALTHLDIQPTDIQQVLAVMKQAATALAQSARTAR